MVLKHKLIRLYRYLAGRCWVCGRHIGRLYKYCSYTCEIYDGVATLKKKIREPRLFEGIVQNYKNFGEKYL